MQAYKDARPEIGQAWRKHFGRHYPAMGLFGINRAVRARRAQVELMGVAVLPGLTDRLDVWQGSR